MVQENLKKIVVICGPTGVGKTEIGLRLAQEFGGEIISADSQQVYRGMDIGTAKSDWISQKIVPHHLIDVVNPDEHFDVQIFTRLADRAIKEITERGRLPFVIGGTGLYIRALCKGMCEAPRRNEKIRDELRRIYEEHGAPHLHKELKEKDPVAAKKIHPNDFVRIARALEVYKLTGQRISDLHERHCFQKERYNALMIGLNMERRLLYDRINKRVERMVENGFLSEVKSLVSRYGYDLKSLKVVGYKEMVDCIKGDISFNDAVNLIKQNTRRLAKRQLTWFRSDKEVKWFDSEDIQGVKNLIRKFIYSS